MNFLFSTSCYKPAYKQGGPIYSVSALAEGLVRKGHSVYVVAPNLDLGDRMDIDLGVDHMIEGVTVRFFDAQPTWLQRTKLPYFSRAGMYAFDREFTNWLNCIGSSIDVFDSHISFLPASGAVSKFAKSKNRVFLYHQRGVFDPVRLEIGKLKKRIYINFIEKNILHNADSLIALTAHEQMTFQKIMPNSRTDIIPNGIDTSAMNRRPSSISSSVKDAILKCGDEPLFFWMSRIHSTKGPDIFVDAAIQSLKAGHEFYAILSGPNEEGLEASLKERVINSGFQNRIIFTGAVGPDDRLALLQRADSFVLPTLSEGFSMVILEALASGCAIITSPGAYFDEIQSYGAGIIIDRSVAKFARAISQLVGVGRGNLAEMGVKGKQLVEEKYTWDSVIEQYIDLSVKLIEEKQKI